MKRNLTVILITVICLVLICCLITYAHSGRTDRDGGHYEHSTGEYHYHHGKPAHQHPNGDCPYEPSNFSILSKILIFIAGILTLPLYVNILLGGLISTLLDFIFSKFKKSKPTAEEQLLLDKKSDKIYGIILKVLFIFETIVWAIIVFKG